MIFTTFEEAAKDSIFLYLLWKRANVVCQRLRTFQSFLMLLKVV